MEVRNQMYICDYCQTEGADVINIHTGFLFHKDCAEKHGEECGPLTPQDYMRGNYRKLEDTP